MWVVFLGWGHSEVNGKLLWRLKVHNDLVEAYEPGIGEGDRSVSSHRTAPVTHDDMAAAAAGLH